MEVEDHLKSRACKTLYATVESFNSLLKLYYMSKENFKYFTVQSVEVGLNPNQTSEGSEQGAVAAI